MGLVLAAELSDLVELFSRVIPGALHSRVGVRVQRSADLLGSGTPTRD